MLKKKSLWVERSRCAPGQPLLGLDRLCFRLKRNPLEPQRPFSSLSFLPHPSQSPVIALNQPTHPAPSHQHHVPRPAEVRRARLHRRPQRVRPLVVVAGGKVFLTRASRWDFDGVKNILSDKPEMRFHFHPASLDGFGSPSGFNKVKTIELMHRLHDNIARLSFAVPTDVSSAYHTVLSPRSRSSRWDLGRRLWFPRGLLTRKLFLSRAVPGAAQDHPVAGRDSRLGQCQRESISPSRTSPAIYPTRRR